jgi:putative ABC transport system permease protein
MRFDPALAGEIPVTEKKYLYIYLSAAIFVLLLAAINYTNLASAISLKRSRELALRKIAGSNRLRIIMEVMMESVVFSLLALFVAVIFVELSRPYFIRVMDRSFVFDYSQLPLFLLIAVLVGLLAGIYPAIFSSRFRVMSLLKETANKGPRGGAFRNVFVMIQFGITSFLLICALTFTRQLHYIQAQDLGMETDQVYNLPVHWSGVKVGALKAALVQNPVIQRVSTSSFGAGLNNWHQTAYWPGPSGEESCQMDVHCVDPDFFETLGIHFLEGADTYRNQGRTDSSVFIISASARDHMGWDRAVGRQYGVFGPGSYGSVAGVVDDIRFRSLHQKGYPTAYVLVDAPLADKMQIKVREDQTGKALAFARQQWKEFAPATAPFMLTSLEEGFANLYEKEQRTRRIVGYFTGFALIISLFGLASMATYISMQRTKEVGVRKVIGANRQGLIRMLIGSFVKWVIIAFLLATPLAYLYLTRWLQNFAYHLDSSALAGVFVISGVFALAVGVSGVLFQAWRVSGTNPVHALRDE